jgi:hypothetical protein
MRWARWVACSRMTIRSLKAGAELRRVRLERNELRVALEPLQIKLSQHRDTPQPDEWYYDVPAICDGGPCESAADALRSAVQHMRRRAIAALASSWATSRRPTRSCAPGSTRPIAAVGLRPGAGHWMGRRLLEQGRG